ncbi:unnamed protein product, partial [Ascophyllum nodosum]
SSFGFRQQAIKEKVHRVLPRNALHSLTARRHQRSTTPAVSVSDLLPFLHRWAGRGFWEKMQV